jgi:hypothetical protein
MGEDGGVRGALQRARRVGRLGDTLLPREDQVLTIASAAAIARAAGGGSINIAFRRPLRGLVIFNIIATTGFVLLHPWLYAVICFADSF